MYYVYEWYVVDTNEIFYVGKGTKDRYKFKDRNSLFKDMIEHHDCKSRIVKEFELEDDAFKYEYERINELKSIGQCSCNIKPGGCGGSSHWWTEDMREWYSVNNVMKLEEQRKRMSENNPMKNKAIAEKVNSQKRRAVIIDGVRFESIKSAAERYKVAKDTICRWCKKGVNSNGKLCRFEDSDQVVFTDKRYNKGGCRKITYKDKTYESAIDCAEDIGVAHGTVITWAKRGFDSNGNYCRYDDDDRELVFENRHVKRNKNKAKPVLVNGIRYSTCAEASEKLGIPKSTLYSYLNGSRKSKEYICTYDNQQPSQGNSSKSTLEGSETNG